MTLVSIGPYETHLDAQATWPRQRYFDGASLGFDAEPIPVVFPAVVAGERINLECFQTGTLYLTVNAGGGSSVRVDLGMYDIDNGTLLMIALLLVGAVGVTSSLDFGSGGAGVLRGRVFRVHDLRVSRTAAGGADPVVTARLWMRS